MDESTSPTTEQCRALDQLETVADLHPFYLAGGSGIAWHLKHRRSMDLDLFSEEKTDLFAVKAQILSKLSKVRVLSETEVALRIQIDSVPVDFVSYPYPSLEPFSRGPTRVPVAGLCDLGTNKFSAVARRGLKRDFWDLFAIHSAGTTLKTIAKAYAQRFGTKESDLYHVVRSLTFFDDAEREPVFPVGMDERLWTSIKAFFQHEVPKLFAELLAHGPMP